MKHLLILAVMLLFSLSVAEAAVLNTTPPVVEIAPPASVQTGALESDTEIFTFDEQQSVTLSSPLAVDVTVPGSYDGINPLTPGNIPAGTVVSSHYFHFDPAANRLQIFGGSATFDHKIIGIIIGDQALDASDSILGAPGTAYPTSSQFRGLEYGFEGDRFTVGCGTIAFSDLLVSGYIDTLRVITDESDDAGCFSLGDTVWYDQDQDGIQDANEPGFNGVSVDLYNNATCSGTPFASTTTGAVGSDGYYQFTDLPAGDYCLQFGNIPAGWSIGPADQGGDDTADSDANGSAQIPNISLTADDPDEDMGVYVTGSLGDSVVCVSTGQGLANITVSLFEDFDGDGVADGPAIATTETNATGFYQFTGLEVALAGDPNNTTNYIVRVDVNDADLGACNFPIPPTEYNPPLDSDNPDDPNNDFSFEGRPAIVGDRVWFDDDGDGVQDAGEAGIPNVTVNLTDCAGNVLASDVTDANGNYLFSGLRAGTYCVVIDQTTLPAGVGQTFEKDGTLDGDTQQPLAPGDEVRDVDFGYRLQPATVGDRVWFDDDGDGVQDAGEAGIPNVTVNLTDCAGNVLASDVTDANGNYLFSGLRAGTYCVVIDQATLPAGVAQTFEKDGTLDGDTQQPLAPGDDVRDVDFGYIAVAITLQKYTRVEAGQTGGDLCDTYDKPQLLTMLYTGDNVVDHNQDPSKVTVTGDPTSASPVLIIASEKQDGGGKVYFTGQVNLDETFVIDATLPGDSELRSETWVTIYDLNGNVLQSIRFHTSCSQPLSLGNQFGGIQLVGFQDKNGNGETLPLTTGFGDDADTPTGPIAVVGDTIVWTYVATNAGKAPLANVGVVDDAGTPGDPSDDFAATPVDAGGMNVGDTNGDGLLDVGEAWQFTASATAAVGQYANLAVASGTAAGVTVTDNDPSHYLGEYSGDDLCASYSKPQILTMLYTGDNILDHSQDPSKVVVSGDPQFADPVLIIASEKENGGGKIYFNGQVSVGETFVIDAKLAGDSELRSETWVTIYDLNGNVLQSIKFHTSCSQPLALGDQFGAIQLVGFQDKDGGGEGQIPPSAVVRADLCQSYGKPQILTMLYTGDNVVDNYQDPSKVFVSGDPMSASPVVIIASEKENGGGKVYFSGQVNVGETFVIDAKLGGDSELRAETWVTIYDLNGNVLQSINFHTSCSQPLTLDDQFGAIQLVGFQDKDGGGEGQIPPSAVVRTDLCQSYGKPQLLTMLYTGDNVVDNYQDPSKVVISGDPQFANPVLIIASEKADGAGKIYFNGQVNVGDTFVIDATLGGDSELRAETWVTIYDLNGNLLQSINFHTSCSQPLTLGDQFGSIQLAGFLDKNGAGETAAADSPAVALYDERWHEV